MTDFFKNIIFVPNYIIKFLDFIGIKGFNVKSFNLNKKNINFLLGRIKKKFKQVLQRIVQKGHEHLTIMFIPHSEKKVHNFQITYFALSFIILIICIVVGVGLSSSSVFSTLKNQRDNLAEQNIERTEDIRKFIDKMPDLKDTVSKLAESADNLLKTTLTKQISEVGIPGIGGVEPDKNIKMLLNFNKERVKEIKELSYIIKNLSLIERDISGMGTLLKGYQKILSGMPSIFPVLGSNLGRGYVVSGFGWRRDPFNHTMTEHIGVDIINLPGTPIVATADGIVKFAQEGGGKGLFVEVQHKFGYSTQYLHLSAIRVKRGDFVKKGQIVGNLGNTGRSTGHHLHYEVRVNNVPIDPLPFITLDKFSKFKNR